MMTFTHSRLILSNLFTHTHTQKHNHSHTQPQEQYCREEEVIFAYITLIKHYYALVSVLVDGAS